MRDDYLERKLRESLDSIVVDANPAHARYRTARRQPLNNRIQLAVAFGAGAVASFILLGLSGSSAPERVTVGLVSALHEIAGDERPQSLPPPHAETTSPSPGLVSGLPAPVSQPSAAPDKSEHHETESGSGSSTAETGPATSGSGSSSGSGSGSKDGSGDGSQDGSGSGSSAAASPSPRPSASASPTSDSSGEGH